MLARTSPLTRARKTLPSFDQTFSKLVAAIEGFDVSKVRYEDVQRAAVFSAPAGEDERPGAELAARGRRAQAYYGGAGSAAA